ncbi:MAG: NnrS family protein [Betaproteobacteria bacterium]|nr:NnrS family protein [Betaproteobacteria bacterium]
MTLRAALWSSGFRPFFLLGAAYGPLAVGLWMLAPLPPLWHGHEMVYGFAVAIVCGVLLTALPSWTGAAELRGAPLAALAALWLLGRAAIFWSEAIPPTVVALLDCALLPALCVLLAPVLGSGRKRLFLWTLPPLLALAIGNVLFHVALGRGSAENAGWAIRLGLHALAFLFSLYGGLLAPAFTRSYLRARGEPAAAIHVPLEYATAAAMVLFAAADLAAAAPGWMAGAALLALAVQGMRALRWRGWRTAGEPLLWTLHLGYLWFIAMFALRALAELTPAVPQDAWTHAFTLGALGLVMTGLMTRVALRHTGRPLVVVPVMQAAYWLVFAAALLRLAYSVPGLGEWVLRASALAWSGVFLIYIALYGPMLVRPSLPRVSPASI